MKIDPVSLVGTVINGRYRLTSAAGEGSYGTVYAADEIAFGNVVGQVAVKLLRPPDDAERQAIVREVQVMAQLAHPHLLTYRAAGEVTEGLASGSLYIATELASGSLGDRLRQPDRMTNDEVATMARHLASALVYLADRGAVHRDVKPRNILRVGEVWKLGDFGLVRGFAGSRMQASGRKGTVLYMSPEAMTGVTGPFVDAWALGVVLQECLAGLYPYSGGSDVEIVAAALMRDPTIADGVPEPFGGIVRGCLEKDHRERLTAHQVLAALPGDGAASPVIALVPSRPAAARSAVATPPRHVPAIGSVRVNPIDGAEMVYVPAGEFLMGSSKEQIDRLLAGNVRLKREWVEHEIPQREVYQDGYWIYRNLVTVAQYRKYCAAVGGKMLAAPQWGWNDDHPMVNVTWHDATAYCNWAGALLPTEAQWEKAARGTDGRIYPWGNAWDASRCVCSVGSKRSCTQPAGSLPSGASPYGCLDMVGNVLEWCADWYEKDYYANAPTRNPTGPVSGNRRVLRDGAWDDSFVELFRAALRYCYDPVYRSDYSGFRCVGLVGSG